MSRRRKPSGRRKLPDKGHKIRGRAIGTRALRQRFLIVCEGEKTEPNYFRSFRASVVVDIFGTGLNTGDVVDYALTKKREAQRNDEQYDQVWAVFDLDEFPAGNFNAAIEKAKKKGVKAAYSNPSFELWFLLHFEYRNSAIDRWECVDILSKKLKKHYEKKSKNMRDELFSQEQDAIKRAEKLFASYQPHNPARDNPCTTVHQLVKELNRHSR